jgi:hypothetical protein
MVTVSTTIPYGRRDLHHLDADVSQDRDRRRGELPGPADALTRWPGLSSSPWIRWHPQRSFPVASRPVSAAIC